MGKQLLFLFLILISSVTRMTAFADDQAVSCRPVPLQDSRLELEIFYRSQAQGDCTGFVVKEKKGRIIQEVRNAFSTRGFFWPSADGRSVAIIEDPLFGTVGKEEKRGTGQPFSSEKPLEEREVVLFFRDGKKVASYVWKDLLVRLQAVEQSESHIHWLIAPQGSAKIASPLPAVLELATTSFRQYRFDTITGKMLSHEDAPAWKTCEIIAYGPTRSEADQRVLSPAFMLKGEKAKELRFNSSLPQIGNNYETRCFEKRGSNLVETRRFPFQLNGLALRNSLE